jgi:hypothetical protein
MNTIPRPRTPFSSGPTKSYTDMMGMRSLTGEGIRTMSRISTKTSKETEKEMINKLQAGIIDSGL